MRSERSKCFASLLAKPENKLKSFITLLIIITGLVELYFVCKLLSYLECSGSRLVVLLRIQRLPLGEQIASIHVPWWKAFWFFVHGDAWNLAQVVSLSNCLSVLSFSDSRSCQRGDSEQQPCFPYSSSLQLSTNTLWPCASASSILSCSAFLQFLEVRAFF